MDIFLVLFKLFDAIRKNFDAHLLILKIVPDVRVTSFFFFNFEILAVYSEKQRFRISLSPFIMFSYKLVTKFQIVYTL